MPQSTTPFPFQVTPLSDPLFSAIGGGGGRLGLNKSKRTAPSNLLVFSSNSEFNNSLLNEFTTFPVGDIPPLTAEDFGGLAGNEVLREIPFSLDEIPEILNKNFGVDFLAVSRFLYSRDGNNFLDDATSFLNGESSRLKKNVAIALRSAIILDAVDGQISNASIFNFLPLDSLPFTLSDTLNTPIFLLLADIVQANQRIPVDRIDYVSVVEIFTGPFDSLPSSTVVDDILFFPADDTSNGFNLLKADRSLAATIQVSDINTDLSNSLLDGFVEDGDSLFFTADDGIDGTNLFALDLFDPELPAELAIARGSTRKTEGNSGRTIFSFNVTRTGDLSSESSAAWSVSASGINSADADDFINGVLPSGTIRFRAGQSTRTINIRVMADLIQEFDEKFAVTLTNPTGATITAARATGVIRNDDLIGTPDNDTITGSSRAEFINGLAGQDDLTGRGGSDRFGFLFGESRIRTPDRITDFSFGEDSISLVNRREKFLPVPQEFSRAADNSTAATFRELAEAVFADADGLTEGNQALAANAAALVQSTNAEIAGTYLLINNGNAGLSFRRDLLIDITGFSDPVPDLGIQPVDSVFS